MLIQIRSCLGDHTLSLLASEDDEDDTPIHPSTSSDRLKEVLAAVEKVNFTRHPLLLSSVC